MVKIKENFAYYTQSNIAPVATYIFSRCFLFLFRLMIKRLVFNPILRTEHLFSFFRMFHLNSPRRQLLRFNYFTLFVDLNLYIDTNNPYCIKNIHIFQLILSKYTSAILDCVFRFKQAMDHSGSLFRWFSFNKYELSIYLEFFPLSLVSVVILYRWTYSLYFIVR